MWTRSIFGVPVRRVPVGRVPMRRVPNGRGYIVKADTFTGLLNIVVLLMYLCVMKDVLFERLFFGRLGPTYAHI